VEIATTTLRNGLAGWYLPAVHLPVDTNQAFNDRSAMLKIKPKTVATKKKTRLPTPDEATERRRLIKLWTRAGRSGSDIARELGISRQRVSQLRDAVNAKRPAQPHVARRKSIPGLIAGGMTAVAISKHLGATLFKIYSDFSAIEFTEAQRAQVRRNMIKAMSDAKIKAHKQKKHPRLPKRGAGKK
jgi:hypothetical protein